MKRGVIDVLRRALDDTIANWPLILLRIGEAIVFTLIAVGAIFVLLVPVAVSVGLSVAKLHTPEDVEQALLLLAGKWMLLVWLLFGVLVLGLLFVAIHSFVAAGCARVLVDAERLGGPANEGPRSRFRVFSMDRWMGGGAAGWWTVFWIYNLAWGAAGLIFLIPLIPTALLMLVFREQAPLLIGTGCVGLALTLMLMLFVGLVTGMWTTRAVVDWAANGTGAAESLSGAWKSFRADLGRHVLIAFAAIVIAMAGSSFFASFSFFAAFGRSMGSHGMFSLITLPIRFIGSLGSTAFSSAVTSWFVAAYAALTVENR